jgi:hypothetical protein
MKQPCGCCSGVEAITPESEANRPGLPALAYRAGTHESFLETMIARLTTLTIDIPANDGSGSLVRVRPLNGKLTTREANDPSIALLDAWATLADVLTFYQERIANEGYLRTAIERRSILEIARLIGYRLRPAVSASVYLAFTVIDGFEGEIPPGTRAQSIPGTGEKPQFFETYDNLHARDIWNNLKPRVTRPQMITLKTNPGTDAATRDTIYFRGIATNLSVGDGLLFVLGNREGKQQLRRVASVEPQAEAKRTAVTLEEKPLSNLDSKTSKASAQALLPFIEEAFTIFTDNDLAKDVGNGLKQLLANIGQAATGTEAVDMVAGFSGEVSNWQGIARRRRFTRVRAWLNDLNDTLEQLVALLRDTKPDDAEGGAILPPQEVRLPQSGLSASPLANLATILDSLAKAPSVQPRNEWRLSRSVQQAFGPQADVSPRILAAFRPNVGKDVYSAWTGIETPAVEVTAQAVRVKAALFASSFAGATTVTQAPDANNEKNKITTVAFSKPTIENAWSSLVKEDKDLVFVALDSVYDRIKAGTWVVIDRPAVDAANSAYARIVRVTTKTLDAGGGFTSKVTVLTLDRPWMKGSEVTKHLKDDTLLRSTIVYAQTEELELAEEPLDNDIEGSKIELAQLYDGLDAGRWIIVSGERTDIPNTSGVRASELVMVAGVSQGAHSLLCTKFPFDFIPFAAGAYVTDANQYGDRLVVSMIALADLKTIQEKMKSQAIATFNAQFCDQVRLAPDIYANAYVPTTAELGGDFADFTGLLVDPGTKKPYPNGKIPPSDIDPQVFAWRISAQPVHTILSLANHLSYKYDPATVTIYGNVVKATHGQTTGEVFGSGDASQPLQKFQLHQTPLTYLSAPKPSGVQSTLVARVNEVEWHESPNLAVLGPVDRGYATETDDSDLVSTIFGNGEHGARIPTGVANVKAVYRYGCGKSGNVAAEQISQLSSQPLGAKSVINPLRASGGADHDTRDQARSNAPLAVMALDRLVSVRDYADFSRTYAGIGKATAARLSDGHTLLVHVTIAGKDDIPIDESSDLFMNLVQSLETFGDPYQPLRVAVRRLKLLVISAGVKVLPDYEWASVGPLVKAALLDYFGFERRDLGQSAFLSEAVVVIQAVPGVQYADMRAFDSVAENITAAQLSGLAATLQTREFVVAELATPDHGAADPAKSILPAELVLLAPGIPDTLTLTEITT